MNNTQPIKLVPKEKALARIQRMIAMIDKIDEQLGGQPAKKS